MCATDLTRASTSKASFHSEMTSPRQTSAGMTLHEASRAKKAVEANVKTVENRISFFKREEEKIWRDLEEVRRQAAAIEEGRTRTLEKKLADQAIQEERELSSKQNHDRAVASKTASLENKRRNQFLSMRERQLAGEEQRRASQAVLRQKKMQDAQERLQNSERAVAIQREKLEARLKSNQERAERLDRLRHQHEANRQALEGEVQAVESKLPELEAEELACLQRLQNSRIVTQSVLEELESSLGAQSSVTALLRQKQRGQEHLDTADALHAGGMLDKVPSTPRLAALAHASSRTELGNLTASRAELGNLTASRAELAPWRE